MLKTICYISDLNGDASFTNLKSIYTTAKENNLKNNITGILIYKNNNFLQVFEGIENTVNDTFKKISADTRHRNLFIIIDKKTENRYFEDYNFGFTIVKDNNALHNLKDYLSWLKNADNLIANEIIAMVENFINK